MTLKICGRCGKEFIAKQSYQKWCSSHCKALARQSAANPNHLSREERRVTNTCKTCGKTWDSTRSRATDHCSVACAHIALMRASCVCGYCGKEYTPKAANRDKYCSRECAFKALRGRELTPEHVKHMTDARFPRYLAMKEQSAKRRLIKRVALILNNLYECKNCGKKNYIKRFCDKECRAEYNKKMKPAFEVECADCGKTFITDRRDIKYCSTACANHAGNHKQEVRRRLTLAKNGKIDYSISLAKLIKRDKGICHICGGKVDLQAHYNSGDYPSIDHIRPVSKGGQEQWSNIALAHRNCNSRKNASMIYEQGNGQLRLAV